jgi:hypothetical protein
MEKEVEEPITPTPQQQHDEEHQKCTPSPKTPKMKKKLILGILAIIVVVVIILISVLYLLGGPGSFSSADSRFVEEWEQNTIGSPFLWKFNNDNTLQKGPSGDVMQNVGTWKVNGTQLCLYNATVCYNYEFSNNGNMLTLNIVKERESYPVTIVLTKKGQQGTNQTPSIACTTDSATNRLTIVSIDSNVKWNDLAITTTPPANWQVQDANNKALAKINITATITTYTMAGDSIIILGTNGDVTITLKFLPTNELLGNWTVNI